LKYDTPQILKETVLKARKAQIKWQGLSIKTRGHYIGKLKTIIAERSDELIHIITETTGKSKIDALSTEILSTVIASRYYVKLAQRILKREKIRRSSILFFNKKSYVYHEPYGVIGIISPWNYPFAIPFHEIVPALLAGNAVILKPASRTSKVGTFMQSIFDETGIPENLFRVVYLPGEKAGNAFVNSGIDKLFFTGSTDTGRKLASLAAQNLLPLSCELGGNDAMIVLPDANIERAVHGALWAGLSNSGQSCGGVERIYVANSVYGKFKEKLIENAKKLRMGFPDDPSIEIGSLTTEQQKEKVSAQVEDAVFRGANILYKSSVYTGKNSLFYPVTILENVPPNAPAVTEETFGPVLVLEKVKNEEEAIYRANDSSLGLTASVWTSDRKKAFSLSRFLETGVVTVNDHLMSHGMPETPWGGSKGSGHSRTHGKWGFYEVTRIKVVVDEKLSWAKRDLWWYPYSDNLFKALKAVLFLFGGFKKPKPYSTGESRPVKSYVNSGFFAALWQLIKLFKRIF